MSKKAVLMSIRPHWCELIASGKKTIEVRKTRPKIETPFKVYIYCTKPTYPHEDFIIKRNGLCIEKEFYAGGRVIGEFVCDKIAKYRRGGYLMWYFDFVSGSWAPVDQMCLTQGDLLKYGDGETLYGWHISDLKIYDEPKDLSDFGLKRAPQSWQFAEVIK